MTSSNPDWLCRSLNVKDEHPIVWKAPLTPEYTVCLRPVSLHTDADIKAIHSWLSQGYPAPLPLDQLRVFFILLGESSYAQAFMVLLNDTIPVGQFEVYQALQDELKDVFEVAEGDYRIYIPVIPVMALRNEFAIHIIESCVQYIFSCAGVKRVFWVVPGHDKVRNKIAVKTGFQLLESFPDVTIEGSQLVNLYQWLGGEW